MNDDPFYTYSERREAFQSFLLSPDGIYNCGCGDPDATLRTVLDALDICALKGIEERQTLLQEKFGVDYVPIMV